MSTPTEGDDAQLPRAAGATSVTNNNVTNQRNVLSFVASTSSGATGRNESVEEHTNCLCTLYANKTRVPLRCVIDTGAYRSIINAAVARSLGITTWKPYSSKQPVVTAGGHAVEILGIATFPLKLSKSRDSPSITVSALVVENLVQKVLLGCDVLRQYSAVLDFNRMIACLDQHEVRIKTSQAPSGIHILEPQQGAHWNESHDEEACPALLATSTTLEPHSGRYVRVRIKDRNGVRVMQGAGCLIPFDINYHRTHATVLKSVSKIRDGRAIAFLVNTTKHAIMIPASTRVGTFLPGVVPINEIPTPASGVIATTEEQPTDDDRAELESMLPNDDEPVYEVRDIRGLIDELECESISPEQLGQLKQLLHKYEHVFARHKKRVTHTELVKCHIDTGEHAPINCPSYRRSPQDAKIIEEEIKVLRDNGVIREIQSPWNSNVVIVAKKDGSRRFCVDFRRINKITKKDVYPLPRIDETLDTLAGCEFISTIDLQSGYHQIALDEESVEKTAFRWGRNMYAFNSMPFGLANAPACFQRLLDCVLHGYTSDFVTCYIDDILAHSKTFEQHLEHLGKVFDRLSKAGLQARWEKCHFVRQQVTFLGHLVSRQGIAPDPAKSEAIKLFPPPTNVRETRRFLGMVGFYRQFIRNYATIATPLTELTKANARFDWSPECQQAFEALRDELASPPILAYPRRGRPYVLTCDASTVGVAGVLAQADDQGNLRPVAFTSKKLNSAERNYNSTHLEGLAIVYSLKVFRPYLLGEELRVETDCQAAVYLFSNKTPAGRLARWIVEISEFSPLTISHRPGPSNVVADALSRAPLDKPYTEDTKVFADDPPKPLEIYLYDSKSKNKTLVLSPEQQETEPNQLVAALIASIQQQTTPAPLAWSLTPIILPRDPALVMEMVAALEPADPDRQRAHQQIRAMQQEDEYCNKFLQYLREKVFPKGSTPEQRNVIENASRQMRIMNGLLYQQFAQRGAKKRKDISYQLVVPTSMQEEVLHNAHESAIGGHTGINKTFEALQRNYTWSGMYTDVRTWIQSCQACQQRKGSHVTNRGEPQSLRASKPFELVGMDVLTLSRAHSGEKKVLVVTDYFSRFAITIALPNESEDSIAKAFIKNVLVRYGAPLRLLTDRGKSFLSKVNTYLYELWGIKKSNTSAYHPQTNGLTERFNRTLCNSLAMLVNKDQNDWVDYLDAVTFAYNTRPQASTLETPFYLMHGWDPITPTDALTHQLQHPKKNVNDFRLKRTKDILETINRIDSNEEHRSEIQQALKHRSPQGKVFQPGEQVMRWQPQTSDGKTSKLGRGWTGPFRIAEVNEAGVAFLLNPDTRRPIREGVNVSNLKRYIEWNVRPGNDPNTVVQRESIDEIPKPSSKGKSDKINIDDGKEFEINRITDVWLDESTGKKWYQVEWQGYSRAKSNENWIIEDDIQADFLVDEFERGRRNANNKKPQRKNKKTPAGPPTPDSTRTTTRSGRKIRQRSHEL